MSDKEISRWKRTGGKHFISIRTPIVIGRLKVANLLNQHTWKYQCDQCHKTIPPGMYIHVTEDIPYRRKNNLYVRRYHISCAPVKFEFK